MSAAPLPGHVAFIMDGNGRWARSRGLLRLNGHRKGADSLRRIATHAARLGIPEVTFFALSCENFARRPRGEIDFLMDLLAEFMIGERETLARNDIRLKTIGRVDELPDRVQAEIDATVRGSAGHGGMVLRLALNYGARREILDGVRAAIEAVRAGRLSAEDIDEESFRSFLYDGEMSDPDLLVRTAGELRLSNFILWQASYTELWVTDVLWPDFDIPHFEEALRAFGARRRKFGAVDPVAPGARPPAGEGTASQRRTSAVSGSSGAAPPRRV